VYKYTKNQQKSIGEQGLLSGLGKCFRLADIMAAKYDVMAEVSPLAFLLPNDK